MGVESLTDVVAGPAGPTRRIALVLNPAAGSRVDAASLIEAIREAFARHGMVAISVPLEAGDLPARLALARDSGAVAVVVAGGDGTVTCAAQVLIGSGIPLGIVPVGTMNLMAKDLGIPVGDPAKAAGVLAASAVRHVDVGEVNGRVFLCASMIGLPARLARHREAGRGGPVLWSWTRIARATLRMLQRFRPMRLAILMEGQRRRAHTRSLTVSVNPLADGTGRQFGRGSLEGGVLAVYAFTQLRVVDIFRVGLSAWSGRWRGDAVVEEWQAAELSIASTRPALQVMNDGEVQLLETPLRYRIHQRALAVLAPAPESGGKL
jgi:diacylglycerol kinase family enzyme